MVPEWSRRKTLQVAGSAVLAGFAGCSTSSFTSRPQVDSSLGTTAYDVVINGQPTVEEHVPAVWGITFAHPDAARKLIDWGALTPAEGDSGPGTEFRTFDSGTQFMTVVVGVLPTGYGLVGYDDENESIIEDIAEDFTERPAYDNGQLRYEVSSYQAFTPEPDDPEYHYDYTFTLWHLNGADRPTEIVVNYHEP